MFQEITTGGGLRQSSMGLRHAKNVGQKGEAMQQLEPLE
jgi:hypothetical protein